MTASLTYLLSSPEYSDWAASLAMVRVSWMADFSSFLIFWSTIKVSYPLGLTPHRSEDGFPQVGREARTGAYRTIREDSSELPAWREPAAVDAESLPEKNRRSGGYRTAFCDSERRDSNPRHPPWQGGALPLSYFRIFIQRRLRRPVGSGSAELRPFGLAELVREKGLEPLHLSALEPKSSVSTNFTTLAFLLPAASARKQPKKGDELSRQGFEPWTRRLRVCCSTS